MLPNTTIDEILIACRAPEHDDTMILSQLNPLQFAWKKLVLRGLMVRYVE